MEQDEPPPARVMTPNVKWKTNTACGQVFEASPVRKPPARGWGPKVVPGSKPKDILKRKSGQCAAVVKSVGLVHYCCCQPLGRLAGTGYDYCDTHDPFAPGATGSHRDLVRGLRGVMSK